MSDIKSIRCGSCGGTVKLDYNNLVSYCPYCGGALSMDMSAVRDILVEKEKTSQNRDTVNADVSKAELKYTVIAVSICLIAGLLFLFAVLFYRMSS